jgi:hypothetical protein
MFGILILDNTKVSELTPIVIEKKNYSKPKYSEEINIVKKNVSNLSNNKLGETFIKKLEYNLKEEFKNEISKETNCKYY